MKHKLLFLIFSLSLVIIGTFFIIARQFDTSSLYLMIRDDSLIYIDIIKNGATNIEHHFKYRILVPLLASALPFTPALSIKVISFISLFATFYLTLVFLNRVTIDLLPAFLALFIVFLSPWQLYAFHNPYLIDSFYILILSLLFYAF